jgi:hypothetical protein
MKLCLVLDYQNIHIMFQKHTEFGSKRYTEFTTGRIFLALGPNSESTFSRKISGVRRHENSWELDVFQGFSEMIKRYTIRVDM